jgi:hypothetical protein
LFLIFGEGVFAVDCSKFSTKHKLNSSAIKIFFKELVQEKKETKKGEIGVIIFQSILLFSSIHNRCYSAYKKKKAYNNYIQQVMYRRHMQFMTILVGERSLGLSYI